MSPLSPSVILSCLDEAASGMILLDEEGRVAFWNRWVTRASGRSSSAVIGKQLPEIFPELAGTRLMTAVDQAMATGLPAALSNKLNKATFPFYTAWNIGREGERMDQMVLVRAIQPADAVPQVLIQIYDVTNATSRERQLRGQTCELRQRERELQESEELFRHIIDTAPVGLAISRCSDGKVVVKNRILLEMLGEPAEDSRGLSWFQRHCLRPEDCLQLEEEVRQDGMVRNREVAMQNREGEVWLGLVSARPIRFLNEAAMLWAIIDITERKRIEDEVRQAKEEAQRADQAKSKFLANISHEIRTPLNAVLGLAGLALRQEISPRVRDYLQKINSSGSILLHLLNDILDLSKIDADRLELETVPFDLATVMTRLAALTSSQAAAKGLGLVFHVDPDLPMALVGDAMRLEQVLINLLGNAIKFTQRGEIVLWITRALIVGEGRGEEEENRVDLQFAVQDTGIGIGEGEMGALFQPFSQADNSTTRRYGGTGLGLAICLRLVALMGGRIWVTSEPGQGSCFRFTARFAQRSAEEADWRRPGAWAGRTVLMVEHGAARAMLTAWLEWWQVKVVAVDSIRGAVAWWEGSREGVDLVLLNGDLDPRRTAERHFPLWGAGRELRTEAPPLLVMESTVPSGLPEEAVGLTRPVMPGALWHLLHRIWRAGLNGIPADPNPEALLADRSRLRGKRVLVVEDNEVNQQLTMDLLVEEGMQVLVANNGLESLRILERESVDLVLMDVQMPVMDGYDATRMLRRNPRLQGIPVIAMTASALPGDRDHCLAVGMDDYLAKPVHTGELFAAMLRWLPGGEAEAGVPPGNVRISRSPETAALPDRMPGLQVAEGLERLEGDQSLYLRVVGMFLERSGNLRETLRVQLERNELAAAERSAHTLKGLAGNIAASELQRTAQALELALRRQEPAPNWWRQMAQLSLDLDLVLASANQLVAATPPPPSLPGEAPVEPGLGTAGTEWLRELGVLLDHHNLKARSHLDQIKPRLLNAGMESFYNEVSSAVDRLDFVTARILLAGLSKGHP